MRIFYASDIHGSEPCFKKFINAATSYEADVLILGGDLAGKALVPIIDIGGGSYRASFMGKEYILRHEVEIQKFENNARMIGFYPRRMNSEEASRIKIEPDALDNAFESAIRLSLREWLKFAEQRLPKDVECYVMPGNDDTPVVEEVLNGSPRLLNTEGRKVILRNTYEMISFGQSNPTPFGSPREMEEAELAEELEALAAQLENATSSILNIHCPPYGTSLDYAPQVDEQLNLKTRWGRPCMIHVGSKAVLNVIKKYDPLLTFHGHCHESRGRDQIGRTISFNPGSEYINGILRGVIVDIVKKNKIRYQFVSA
ncbi:MAG: metallophosphoesterase [Candidatus Abyssobacteria bacterium SURF_5]|uniref:Metallophosphoesterase n=1 Tax=Abyssobacteria bacterium (strain SURF_5) TaxID=2093360 RepID=A0A3A4NEF0_ABYX5|nr:MAG: metallophosphoesterase [Candidatus Abyssubacteria bacterium SURF_5]